MSIHLCILFDICAPNKMISIKINIKFFQKNVKLNFKHLIKQTLIESCEGGIATAGLYCSFPLNFSKIFFARLLTPLPTPPATPLAPPVDLVSWPGNCWRGVADGIPLPPTPLLALLLLGGTAGEGISEGASGFWPVPGSTGVWIPCVIQLNINENLS